MPQVICALPFLSRHDAVSNDSRLIVAALAQAGYDASLYAELFEPGCETESISPQAFIRQTRDPSCIVIVQMAVAWHALDGFLPDTPAIIVLRYHNMTPPAFFDAYDPQSAYATRAGLRQMGQIWHHPKVKMVVACSQFNLDDAEASWGAARVPTAVVAPLFAREPHLAVDAAVKARLSDGRVHLFFIGRWVPNKGHQHLLGVLSSYVELYGEGVCLTIAGNAAPNFASYQRQIVSVAAELGLSQHLKLVGSLSHEQLATYLQYATAFIVTSEHEGFCVPIVEAQHAGLPVLALARTAVPATLGPEQLLFAEPEYDLFACAAQRLHSDRAFRDGIVQQGQVNAARFHQSASANALVAALAPL